MAQEYDQWYLAQGRGLQEACDIIHHFILQPPSTKEGKKLKLGRGRAKNYWASIMCRAPRESESSFAYIFSFCHLRTFVNPKKEAALSPNNNHSFNKYLLSGYQVLGIAPGIRTYEKTEAQRGDVICSKSHSLYVADQDKIPSLLRLIPRLFSFRDSAQTQMHRYAHTFTYTHKYICTHMHTPAHTHIHTHTPFNVQVLTLHSCSHTNIYTDMQTNTPTGTHTHTHHSSTQTQMRTYSHIYSHTPLHSLRRIFFLNCWNLLLFQVGNVAAAPIPEASFSSQPQLLCHHCTLRFKLTPCSWVSPAPAPTSPALSRMCQAPAKASCKYFVMPRGGDASIFVSTFCFHLAFSWPVKR